MQRFVDSVASQVGYVPFDHKRLAWAKSGDWRWTAAPVDPAWSVNAAGRKTWPIDSYLDEGRRSTDWLTKGVIKQHRTVATYVNMLVGCGFAISHVEEWGPTREQIASRPSLADERQRPPFLLVAARR